LAFRGVIPPPSWGGVRGWGLAHQNKFSRFVVLLGHFSGKMITLYYGFILNGIFFLTACFGQMHLRGISKSLVESILKEPEQRIEEEHLLYSKY